MSCLSSLGFANWGEKKLCRKLLLAAILGTQESIIIVSEKHIYFLISTFKYCHEQARDVGLHLAELWYDLTNMWKFTVCVHSIRWTVYNPLILPHWKQLNRTDKHIWTVQSSHLNDTILLLSLYVEDMGAPLLTTEEYRALFMSWSQEQ